MACTATSRAVQSVHGEGADHWSSPTPPTRRREPPGDPAVALGDLGHGEPSHRPGARWWRAGTGDAAAGCPGGADTRSLALGGACRPRPSRRWRRAAADGDAAGAHGDRAASRRWPRRLNPPPPDRGSALSTGRPGVLTQVVPPEPLPPPGRLGSVPDGERGQCARTPAGLPAGSEGVCPRPAGSAVCPRREAGQCARTRRVRGRPGAAAAARRECARPRAAWAVCRPRQGTGRPAGTGCPTVGSPSRGLCRSPLTPPPDPPPFTLAPVPVTVTVASPCPPVGNEPTDGGLSGRDVGVGSRSSAATGCRWPGCCGWPPGSRSCRRPCRRPARRSPGSQRRRRR